MDWQGTVAETLAPLTCLRVLRIHLDLREAPEPWACYRQGEEIFSQCSAACQRAADSLARALAPSVQWICLLKRRGNTNAWQPYRVLGEDACAGFVPRARLEDASIVGELEGMPYVPQSC